ncbi:MAG TPA: 4Fe-4S dicluster domain-containing protein, partial [Verrucomicrobiae bacterium]|nr:4Fe-4S dicluster domain-containing protein [Verrucomicrobiae bacterium]
SNADHRLPITSGEVENFARLLAEALGAIAKSKSSDTQPATAKFISALVRDLQINQGKSIIIAGERQPPVVHVLAHAMNHFFGNVGNTIDYTVPAESNPVNQLESLRQLTVDLRNDSVDLLVMVGGNPAFNAPTDFQFAANLAKAKLRIHLSADVNETSALCQWHIPQNHFLESWSDARAFDGTVSIVQPLILPLYAGRSAHELLDALWQTQPRSDYEIVHDHWQLQNQIPLDEKKWRRALHDGLIAGTAYPQRNVSLHAFVLPPVEVQKNLELTFHPDSSIWDGRYANNGWLQELPKPIHKLTWDNVACVSPELARRENLSNGDFVELASLGAKLSVPIWITPGQAENSIAVSLGYGRQKVGHVGSGSGFNTFTLRTSSALWIGNDVTLRKTGERYQLATTQTQHVIDSDERQIFRETTLADFLNNPKLIEQSTETPARDDTLFKPQEHDYDGYRWGMAIDLTACTGCNACIMACQAENNIPVVGKDQVARHRAMHWLRVDTYFSGPSDAPQMNHEPVPCMHCEDAPCEVVCPVGATVHDHEGLNLQVYNRCVGTRYCSNNCPYKVRRFNFYQYADKKTPVLKLAKNPNVTVRSRGVMEKCTYCIQRISVARIQSKLDDRKIQDGEIKTACQQVCPAEAIVFGDIGDPNSRVSKLKAHPLNFSMLGQLNTRPRTTYSARVRNPNPELAT